MWAGEVAAGDVTLMRVRIESFSDSSQVVPDSNYQSLPKPAGYTVHNRFSGNYLLYGTGSGWGAPEKVNHRALYVVGWANGDWADLNVAHGIDRIEAMGDDAVAVGTD